MGRGLESSLVYHGAKKAFYPLLISPWINYLDMSESIRPNVVVLAFGGLFGFSVRMMASTFKKYL